MTNPSFTLGTPASSVIPKVKSSGSHTIRIKRAPHWRIEPDLAKFSPIAKAEGVDYTIMDIASLARTIPQVSL